MIKKIFFTLLLASSFGIELNAQSFVGVGLGRIDLPDDSLSWTSGYHLSFQRKISFKEKKMGLNPLLEVALMHGHSNDSIFPQYFSAVSLSPLFFIDFFENEKWAIGLQAGPSASWVLGIKKGDIFEEPYGPQHFSDLYLGVRAGVSIEYAPLEKLRLKLNPLDYHQANNSFTQWSSTLLIRL